VAREEEHLVLTRCLVASPNKERECTLTLASTKMAAITATASTNGECVLLNTCFTFLESERLELHRSFQLRGDRRRLSPSLKEQTNSPLNAQTERSLTAVQAWIKQIKLMSTMHHHCYSYAARNQSTTWVPSKIEVK